MTPEDYELMLLRWQTNREALSRIPDPDKRLLALLGKVGVNDLNKRVRVLSDGTLRLTLYGKHCDPRNNNLAENLVEQVGIVSFEEVAYGVDQTANLQTLFSKIAGTHVEVEYWNTLAEYRKTQEMPPPMQLAL